MQELINRDLQHPSFTKLGIDEVRLNQDMRSLGILVFNDQEGRGGTKSGLSHA